MAKGGSETSTVNKSTPAFTGNVPSSVELYDQSLDNSLRKEIVYKELDRVPVNITDTNPLSPNYLRITYLPNEFKLGKNLIRIRPNIPAFEENTQLYIEIIDYNGDPVYYETELNSETDDTFVIISVYIYEDTPPGPCAVYILGTLKDSPIPAQNQIYPVNFRWANIINIDTAEKTDSPVIFTTLPKVTVLSNTSSYDISVYNGGSPFTSSKYYNLSLNNGILNPSITPLNSLDTFTASMSTGDLYVNYEDIQLITPARFTSNFLLGNGITASIKDYISNKSMTLDSPIVIYQQNKSEQIVLQHAIFKTASIAYEQGPSSIIAGNFKKRILNVLFEDLDPFAGQIRSVKTMYRNMSLQNTEYLLLSDFLIPSTNIYEGFNPLSASFSLLLPDSEIDEYYDVRFEFYNNENIPSKQILTIRNLLAPGIPDVTVNSNGILMIDPVNATVDGKNISRTLYQDYDIHGIYYSAVQALTGSSYPINDSCDQRKSITQFTAFVPDGSSYVTVYYNAAIINLTEQTVSSEQGYYNYNTMLSIHEMSTSSYSNFTYDIDQIALPKILESTASITMYSGMPANQTAFAYPVQHTVQLPETNKLYRFSLSHNITVTGSGTINSASFDVSCSLKDLNILSSGFLFISASKTSYISGAYSYNIPNVI